MTILPKSLFKTILYALDDKNRWVEIGENCHKFAIDYLDTKKIMSSINNVYKRNYLLNKWI